MKKEINILRLLLIAVVVIIVAMVVVFVLGNEEVNYSELTEVKISKIGTMIPNGNEYTLTLKDGTWIASHNEIVWLEDNINKKIVDDVFANEIKNLLAENKVENWDGFNEENKYITDGEKFAFYMCFSDGTEVEASGYMAYPKTFGLVFKEFEEHYENLFG